MCRLDSYRGYRIVSRPGDLVWIYEDTSQPVAECRDRPCGHCGRENTPEGHDGCLGTLPGVANACCGHGSPDCAYIQFDDGRYASGAEAREMQTQMTREIAKWKRRALHYHEHALRERERANRLEAELDESRQWDARIYLASAIEAEGREVTVESSNI